jgi:alpha-tubulin suppressor-like RCC1 family protein
MVSYCNCDRRFVTITNDYISLIQSILDGTLLTFGKNEEGELGNSYEEYVSSPQEVSTLPVKKLCMSSPVSATMIWLENDQILATGSNSQHQLGFLDTRKRKNFETVPFNRPANSQITHVVSGGFIVAIVTNE